jgi:ABC-type sugar transport system ATPase subunit
VLRDGKSVADGHDEGRQQGRHSGQNDWPVSGLALSSARRTTPAETIVQVDNLSGFTKLKNASFSLRRGEVLGISSA